MIDLHQRSAGILLHVTSLPGPHGIGDFGPDAYRFVDWLVDAGQNLWQWLPGNPIGPGDSPYQSVSAFAGSPLMIALEPLVAAGWLPPMQAPLDPFDPLRVEFSRVVPWRLAQLRTAHAGFERKQDPDEQREFAAWQAQEAGWLQDYALFMALETEHGGQPWWTWAVPLRNRDRAALRAARELLAAECAFWCFAQWCFDSQLAALKGYANRNGVAIMGDLPIFIAHHSADCWSRPDLYELDADCRPTFVAGCPPDAMASSGQRWGNPLYRWDRMADEDYAWWTSRLRRALTHADVFRIDHFRGFAGYYKIPASCATAEQGEWVPGPGQALFEAIGRALGELPIVAEDLGHITHDVIELREACGFPGMKVLQFGFAGDGSDAYLPHNWERHFVAYTGTHDNHTALGWWQAAPEHERAYAGTYLPATDADVHWAMIRACCNSVANIAVFPLQDVLGLDDSHRMNVPGTVGPANWTWRFRWDWIDEQSTWMLRVIARTSGRGNSR